MSIRADASLHTDCGVVQLGSQTATALPHLHWLQLNTQTLLTCEPKLHNRAKLRFVVCVCVCRCVLYPLSLAAF